MSQPLVPQIRCFPKQCSNICRVSRSTTQTAMINDRVTLLLRPRRLSVAVADNSGPARHFNFSVAPGAESAQRPSFQHQHFGARSCTNATYGSYVAQVIAQAKWIHDQPAFSAAPSAALPALLPLSSCTFDTLDRVNGLAPDGMPYNAQA